MFLSFLHQLPIDKDYFIDPSKRHTESQEVYPQQSPAVFPELFSQKFPYYILQTNATSVITRLQIVLGTEVLFQSLNTLP